MKKLLVLSVLNFVIFSGVFAQKAEQKPGCNPSACKPGDTKKEEAQVITDLRADLVLLAEAWKTGTLESMDLTAGSSDVESLEKMILAFEEMRKDWGNQTGTKLEPLKYPAQLAKRARRLQQQIDKFHQRLGSTR